MRKIIVFFVKERVEKTDEGERMKMSQRNVNLCLKRTAKVLYFHCRNYD